MKTQTDHKLKPAVAVGSGALLACALHDARKALGRAFDAAADCGLEKTKIEIALTIADVSSAADKADALAAQANEKK
jgi:hypothetical protein